MNKNLVMVPAGDSSLHTHWISGNCNFDLIIIYYGNSEDVYNEYKTQSLDCVKNKGEKWHLIHNYIKNNFDKIKHYEYIWFPDDDLLSNSDDINTLFYTNKEHELSLSQPSLDGYVSYDIEKKVEGSKLRFTSFVEIICPMMSKNTCFNLLETFIINESGWGLDYLWPKLLGYSQDKIAIIDKVEVEHTRPVGSNYSNRFKKEPMQELNELFRSHNLGFYQTVYKTILL
jgi:hypothetical protein